MTLNGLHAMKRLQAGWGFGDTALCVFFLVVVVFLLFIVFLV